MTPELCSGLAPAVFKGWRSRLIAHAQRCGAYREPGIRFCAAHAAAAGYRRCPKCRGWMVMYPGAAAALSQAGNHCPACCTCDRCLEAKRSKECAV